MNTKVMLRSSHLLPATCHPPPRLPLFSFGQPDEHQSRAHPQIHRHRRRRRRPARYQDPKSAAARFARFEVSLETSKKLFVRSALQSQRTTSQLARRTQKRETNGIYVRRLLLEAVALLLDRGASLDKADSFGNTPLLVSSANCLRRWCSCWWSAAPT